jgi:hypothetical protein
MLILGAAHNIVALDCKKRSDSEKAAFDFRTKSISVFGIEEGILKEIQKFPYPLQQLLVQEASAVMSRIERGKRAPGLTSLDCYCVFRNRYLLPCKHIFHEHMYGSAELLTNEVWAMFQKTFEENGFEIYERRELVIIERTEQQKEADKRKLTVNELTERIRDGYWRVEERGDVSRTEAYVHMLETSLDSIIMQFNK